MTRGGILWKPEEKIKNKPKNVDAQIFEHSEVVENQDSRPSLMNIIHLNHQNGLQFQIISLKAVRMSTFCE